MSFITYKCKTCEKSVTSNSYFDVGQTRIHSLSCGHSQTEDLLEFKGHLAELIRSEELNPKKLFPFQIEGVKAAEKANMNFLFADEMGLGKTTEVLATILLHKTECLPVAVICKSSLKANWSLEISRWFGIETLTYTIENANTRVPLKCSFYIFSFDILRRFNGKIVELFQKIGIKTIVIDECQHIKNQNSQRSKAVQEICKVATYKLAASGTPIKNHAAEYFPILNILRPQTFRYYQSFVRDWCDSYWNGYQYKVGGIKNIKRFREYTKEFIIRRERKEVLPDLPSLNRMYTYHDLGDSVKDAYERIEKETVEYAEQSGDSAFDKASNILSYINKMRHLTGLSKVENALEFIEDFLLQTDRKLTVFIHHKDVGELLLVKVTKLIEEINKEFDSKKNPPQQLTASLNSDARLKMCEDFQNIPENRILIASTLASGEGLNLQKCSDCLLVERQWNPANEEQAEARFIRIGQFAESVSATYLVALGTIDEYFAELVERKRSIMSQVLDGKESTWDESNIIKELTEKLIQMNTKKWRLK